MKQLHAYLLEFSYQGHRYQGWLKQPAPAITIQGIVQDCIEKILGNNDFKLMAASRTDAQVSSLSTLAKLTINGSLQSPDLFMNNLNLLLPSDIRLLHCKETTIDYDIINDPKEKIYHYDLNRKELRHLNLEIMKSGAKYFEGEHNFKYFAFRPRINQIFNRKIIQSEIIHSSDSIYYVVRAQGFLRHQVRLMVGALIRLGSGEIQLEDLKKQLEGREKVFRNFPADGEQLLLYKTIYT